jgi:endonuclease/exonuclease/phosphatase (EEP) superfamily protein YafD
VSEPAGVGSAVPRPEDAEGPASVSEMAAVRSGRWCLATRLLVAAAAGWLLFAVAQRVLSGRVWLWLVPDLMPPLAFVVAPLLLVAALGVARAARRPVPRQARLLAAGAALAALALGWSQSGVQLAAPFRSQPAVPAGAVRIVSWNTMYWDQTDDPTRFYDYLTSLHADVYLLQEYLYWVDDKPAPVDDMASLRHAFPGYTIVASGELITLSRLPVVATPAVGPARDLRPGSAFDAVYQSSKVLRTDLSVGGRILSVYNVHIPIQLDLRNPLGRSFYQIMHQRSEARQRQYRGLMADLDGNPHQVLVAGDFNTSPAMGDIDGIRARLRDAVHASTSVYPASWLDRGGVRTWRLDWAFTGNGLDVWRYRFIGSDGMSDHRAQLLVLSTNGAEAR